MLNIWRQKTYLLNLSSIFIILLTLTLASCTDNPTESAPSGGMEFIPFESADTGGWEQQNGIHNAMNCIWGTRVGNIFAAGNNGSILHYSGGTDWNPSFMLPGITWQGIWGPATDTVYAVGSTESGWCCPGRNDIGVVYRYTNGGWQQVVGLAGVAFVDIWGSASDDVYAVGADNSRMVLAHFDGNIWQTITDPIIEQSTAQALAVWGSSASDVFVAGADGVVIHFNGTSWQQMDTPGENIFGLWGTGPSDVYACDSSGQILHFDGTEWAVQAQFEQPLQDVFGFTTGEIFICGEGVILEKNGSNWVEMEISEPRYGSSQSPHEYYSELWGATPERMFAVGTVNNFGSGYKGSLFMSQESGSWRFMNPPAGANINDMWGVNENEIYAAGGLSTLLHFNGSRWLPITIPNLGTWPSADGVGVAFLSVWASGHNDIYAGTRTGLWHFDGIAWSYSQAFHGARDLWGTGPQNVFAIEHKYDGGPGPFQVMHFDGSTWQSIGEVTGKPYKIQGLGNGSIVVVGTQGLCRMYDGSTWTDLATKDSGLYFSTWGDSLENFYLGRYDSKSLLRFDNVNWENIDFTSGGGFTAYLILGNAPDNLFVLSDRESDFFHFDGSEWGRYYNTGLHVRGGWSGENTLFAGGRGQIFHKSVSRRVALN